MSDTIGVFTCVIHVVPPTPLNLSTRPVDQFALNSIDASNIEASSTHPDAEKQFRSDRFLEGLERLSWDLVWESQVAVQFAVEGSGKRVAVDDRGRQVLTFDIEDRIDFNPGDRKAGIETFGNFGLLQNIRDYLIQRHLAGGDQAKTAKLMGDGATLLAMEHFIKGVVSRSYAFAEFYSVMETIAHQTPGGRKALEVKMTKSTIDKITKFANEGQLDQRHAPKDPGNVLPLPPNAIEDAAMVAKDIILAYTNTIV